MLMIPMAFGVISDFALWCLNNFEGKEKEKDCEMYLFTEYMFIFGISQIFSIHLDSCKSDIMEIF